MKYLSCFNTKGVKRERVCYGMMWYGMIRYGMIRSGMVCYIYNAVHIGMTYLYRMVVLYCILV